MKLPVKLLLSTCLIFLLGTIACQKGTGGGNANEESLVIQTVPIANGHVEAAAPGPDFPLRVTVTSAMPASGVKIEVTAKPDGGTVAFFTQSKTSTTATTDFTITGTPTSVTCIVEITVSSVSSSSNKWTGNYKYSRK